MYTIVHVHLTESVKKKIINLKYVNISPTIQGSYNNYKPLKREHWRKKSVTDYILFNDTLSIK